jgi:beta-galactosidase
LWGPLVTAMSAVNPAGKRLWFVHNWSGDEVTVRPPVRAERLLPVDPGEAVVLGAWDVVVLEEAQ